MTGESFHVEEMLLLLGRVRTVQGHQHAVGNDDDDAQQNELQRIVVRQTWGKVQREGICMAVPSAKNAFQALFNTFQEFTIIQHLC